MQVRVREISVVAAALAAMLAPSPSSAAACHICNLGLDGLIPQVKESTLFLEVDLSDQNKNWSGTSRAPAADNPDKVIRDDFFIVGGEFKFDDRWSARIEVPVTNQTYKGDTGTAVETFQHAALGDIRLTGLYSGILDDGSAILLFSLKLPTGDTGYPGFAIDTQIGTGSTDALVGLSYEGKLTDDEAWTWSGQLSWSKPLTGMDGFTPGTEVDAAFAVSYNGLMLGGVRITPTLQWSGSSRTKDGGVLSNPANTGCDRILLSPGVELAFGKWTLTGDVEFPVYRDVNGNQLVADRLFKFVVSYSLAGKDA